MVNINYNYMVAERSVRQKRKAVMFFEDIRSEYTGMSSVKQSEKLCRRKPKVFEARLILFNSKLFLH